jgi:hypothetical protein
LTLIIYYYKVLNFVLKWNLLNSTNLIKPILFFNSNNGHLKLNKPLNYLKLTFPMFNLLNLMYYKLTIYLHQITLNPIRLKKYLVTQLKRPLIPLLKKNEKSPPHLSFYLYPKPNKKISNPINIKLELYKTFSIQIP